jgi:hypothetical protein
VVFLTDLVSVVDEFEASGLIASPFCESLVVVEECDSTVVLGGLLGAGAADVLAGAGSFTTVGAGGVCWQPAINISPITAGASETMHLE